MHLIFIGEIVAHGYHMEVAGFYAGFDRLGYRRLDSLLSILWVPGRVVFKILRVGSDFLHESADVLVSQADKTLRTAFSAAGVAVDLNKTVGKVHRLIVLYPVNVECNPVFGIAGLVRPDQVTDDL